MKTRKKYRSLLLAALLCLSLAACGDPDGDKAGAGYLYRPSDSYFRESRVVDEPPADDILTEQT